MDSSSDTGKRTKTRFLSQTPYTKWSLGNISIGDIGNRFRIERIANTQIRRLYTPRLDTDCTDKKSKISKIRVQFRHGSKQDKSSLQFYKIIGCE